MSQFPAVTGKQMISALSQIGFFVQRVKGSHHFLRHDDGRTTVIPVHAGDTLGSGILLKILKDCGLTREELQDLL
jgi:predicted RNA binding protein YcfA (HicA-like mRNA interferase family)